MDLPSACELHPASLPAGTRVGHWRILDWRGRGTSGAVYRAVRADLPHGEPVALKLALTPLDPRFSREVTLLSRLKHPHVPAVLAHGRWEHEGRLYPYLVMQWVEGSPLYDWAATHNPTSRQAMRVLAQVARALQATHAVGGVHRDVKGDNLLVRADGQACLMDFGSGHYAGASLLTFEPLPPGTPTYRSPEAWRFSIESSHLRTAHYPANPADDLFALGVTAYRLVTEEYPPTTDPGEHSARLWYLDSAGPRAPWRLNPRVDPQLSTLILRMLAVRPAFRGTARELAGLLEQEAESAGPQADQPLFAGQPSPPVPPTQRESETLVWAAAAPEQHEPPAPGLVWLPWLGAGIAIVLLLVLCLWWQALAPRLEDRPAIAYPSERPGLAGELEDGGTVELAPAALTAPIKEFSIPRDWPGLTLDIPRGPLPGQRRPDMTGKCRRQREIAINGGCWVELANEKPPCEEDGYAWGGACYYPVVDSPRQPLSDNPAPLHGEH
ncbi:serine/threonine-protein kinase [Hyalangium rubrum]|uniref:non-specific serine/threonine protein kinase n=1 Tax=Hyalangium rubrum TaxID=3103134 RepID=A0ABU5HD56_9BACT|nr:serine/threonine-protein kinase [Hyalangium sp. s54d21]MDY7230757.1 serine/threonine-protein kinase [Hyalangium sp. s54d21]